MSKIMELADAFAVESSSYKTLKFPTLDDKAQYDKARAALQAEVEMLEKDAERYRWLRERDDWVLMPGMRSEVCLRSNLDDQIDMSMGAFIGATK